jgi:excinuclease ABC subunit C
MVVGWGAARYPVRHHRTVDAGDLCRFDGAAGCREKVKLLPHQAGIYQFLDADGKIIYVGKAKDLRHRVSSYFTRALDSGKTAMLVSRIRDVRVLVVNNQYEALLLENSLIKEHQPRYNIQWRDDKSYPFIRIRDEHFPRVEGMRNPEDDGSEYFGPYGSVKVMKALLRVITQSYQLRTCNYDLTPENIARGSSRSVLSITSVIARGPARRSRPRRTMMRASPRSGASSAVVWRR